VAKLLYDHAALYQWFRKKKLDPLPKYSRSEEN